MRRVLVAIFWCDVRQAVRAGGGFGIGLLFYACLIAVVPFAVGPDLQLLARLGPALLWIGALLATLLGLERLFKMDAEDGVLDILRSVAVPLEPIVLVKVVAHWMVSGFPLVLASPLLGMMLNMSPGSIGMTCITLVLGTPALTLLGALGAALTVGLKRGGLLLPVLVLPLSVPIVIFGVAVASTPDVQIARTALLLLGSITLCLAVLVPFAAASLLRWDES
jgi:heme exporter protein B